MTMTAHEETLEVLRIMEQKCETYKDQYLKSVQRTRLAVLRDVRHEFDKLVRELRAHHMDAVESALLDVLTTRYHESLDLLTPAPEPVPHSGR